MVSETKLAVLELLVERGLPVRLFFLSDNDFTLQTNSVLTGSIEKKSREILECIENGLIFSNSLDVVIPYLRKQIDAPTIEELNDVVGCSNSAGLRLTSEGGEYWDLHCHPNWKLFFVKEIVNVVVELETWRITTMDEFRLTEVVNALVSLENMAVIESHDVFRVSPWNGLYWKDFDLGYRIEIEVRRNNSISTFSESELFQLDEILNWKRTDKTNETQLID